MQDDGGEGGQEVGEAGRDISSTPSDDVEMLEGQDQELVVGTGTRDDIDITKYNCRLGTHRGQPCGYTKELILTFTLES
jgi:hypothetical protein